MYSKGQYQPSTQYKGGEMDRTEQIWRIHQDMNMPTSQAERIFYHCDGCPKEEDCGVAWDAYNTYGEGIIDTGCLMEK